MYGKVLIGLAAAAVVAGVVVASQPSRFRIARTAAIEAPPERVFAEVNDLHRWEAWSPWLKEDPSARTTYEGPAAGAGAVFTWSGNSRVGAGRMTITESRPAELVRLRLDFVRPLASTAIAELTMVPDGPRTVVTWSMSGEKGFVAKAIHLVMDMDAMIGAKFDEGLAGIGRIAERSG